MAADHGRGHSMTCVSRFWLSRPIDLDEFSVAVSAVAACNPLLAARRKGNSWLPVAFDQSRQVDWSDAGVPDVWQHLDSTDSLVHWTVRVGRFEDLGIADAPRPSDHGTLVVIRYQHAIADGLAAVACMEQVCARLSGTHPPPPPPLDARLNLDAPIAESRRRVRWESERILRYLCSFPVAYVPDPQPTASRLPLPIVCVRHLMNAVLTRDLLTASRDLGVTLNDVLVAALFRALRPETGSRAVIRIAVPTSLRPHGNVAFCNMVSMVFLDRRASCTAARDLLHGVSAEMNHIKRWKLGHAMHSFLATVIRDQDWPWAALLRVPSVSATAVLSNLGEPVAPCPRPVGVRIVAHDLLPPLRPGTNVAVAATTHEGRLGLTARYAPDRVSASRAVTLIERMVAEAAAMLGVNTTAASA